MKNRPSSPHILTTCNPVSIQTDAASVLGTCQPILALDSGLPHLPLPTEIQFNVQGPAHLSLLHKALRHNTATTDALPSLKCEVCTES